MRGEHMRPWADSDPARPWQKRPSGCGGRAGSLESSAASTILAGTFSENRTERTGQARRHGATDHTLGRTTRRPHQPRRVTHVGRGICAVLFEIHPPARVGTVPAARAQGPLQTRIFTAPLQWLVLPQSTIGWSRPAWLGLAWSQPRMQGSSPASNLGAAPVNAVDNHPARSSCLPQAARPPG